MKKIACALIAGLLVTACGDDGPSSPTGDGCDSNDDCESGFCLTDYGDGTEVAGGICTEECEWTGSTGHDDTCPEGQACLNYTATGEKHCYLDCTTDADCRTEDGWVCSFLLRTCIPPL